MHSLAPVNFAQEYERLRLRTLRFLPKPQVAVLVAPDVAQARALCVDIERFTDLWEQQISHPEVDAIPPRMRAWVAGMRQHIEDCRFSQMLALLATRSDWAETQTWFDAARSLAQQWQQASPEARPALEASYLEETGVPFQLEEEFRKTASMRDYAANRFKAAWEVFQAAFPEEATEALRQRLLKADPEAIKAWQEELTAKPAPRRREERG